MKNIRVRILISLVSAFLITSIYSKLSTDSLVSPIEATNIKGLLSSLKFPSLNLTKLFTLKINPTNSGLQNNTNLNTNSNYNAINNFNNNSNNPSFNLPSAKPISPQQNYIQPTTSQWSVVKPKEPTPTYSYSIYNMPTPSYNPTKIPTQKPKPTKPPKPTKTPTPKPITSDLRPGTSLYGIFDEVSKRACFPTALLKAIQYKESGSYFKPSDPASKIKIYNTYGWWINGTGNPCTGLGYSFQTGIVPPDSVNAGISCNGAIGDPNDLKIMGITSISEWEQSVAQKYITNIIPKNDRRVLFDNALMFAYISRSRVGNPPSNCNDWPDDAVRLVAEKHSGTCFYAYTGTDISGDYCKEILDLYKKYKKEE